MRALFYLQAIHHLLQCATADTSNGGGHSCSPKTEHVEPTFLKDLCKSNPELDEFMTAADIMVRSGCFLVDACRRVVERPHADVEEVDFVVVGGGVAGPVVAGRLSENANWTVTLLESGPEQPAATDIPAFLSSAVGSKYDWKYVTVPQKNACLASGGVCGWPRGKMLGGTAALSGSMYSRGHRDVYDGWARDGNDGWGYDDVLPFFKMSENNKDYADSAAAGIHGTSGPIPVQRPKELLPITRALIEAARELGYAHHVDMSEPNAAGFAVAQTMFDGARTRVTTPTAYLRPHYSARPNLRVKINSHVTRLLVRTAADGREEPPAVYGVEFVDRANVTRRLLARKEVILTAGVIGSAHLLMVSGIGPAEDLRPLGVPVVRDLRVGRNLQHHVAVKLEVPLRNATHGRYVSYDSLVQYLRLRTGPLSTTGGLQTSALLRSDRAAPDGPTDVQLFFDGFAAGCANARPRWFGGPRCADDRAPDAAALLVIRPVNTRPVSRGAIRLASADPFVRPLIDPGYLAADADVAVLVWALKLAASLADARALRRMGAEVDATPAAHCRQHAFATDAYWRCVIRYHTRGENHHAGTCKMGPASDAQAVVDPRLRVHGVRGVRVADASVMPEQPNANPIAAVVMIAEKAARFVKDAWT